MGPVTGAPRIVGDQFIAEDGAALPLRRWVPSGKVEAVVLALHGFNDYSNAVAMPAEWWAGKGILTYAYDQRGFGGAPGRGYWAGTPTLIRDLRAAARAVKAAHPDIPVYVLGVSMGGAVVMAALADGPIDGIDGAVLAAPAVWGRAHMNIFQRGGLWLLSNTMPGLTLSGEGLEIQPSDNFNMLRALSRDDKMIRETRVDAILGLVDLMDAAYQSAPRLGSTPVLILYGLKDEIVPRDPVRAVMAQIPDHPENRRALYDTAWHMLLRDLKAKRIWRDIAAWIIAPTAPLPSGADKGVNEALMVR
jgi:alpha-beta hydrolase superfamily lysophospholipase